MAKRGRFIDVESTPRNLLAIWTRIHDLDDLLSSANSTIESQRQTIAGLQTQITAVDKQAQQAAIAAGKSTAAATTTNTTGPGGGGSGGGNGSSHENHYATVVAAKADLITAGVSLVGPCGAFEIVKRVAQMLAPSESDVGLLDKPTGNNCIGYAVDIICYNDGVIYDILIDAGGANTPQWSFAGTVDPSRYRVPI